MGKHQRKVAHARAHSGMLSLDGAACLFALLHEAPVGTQQPHQLNDSENSGRRTKNTATVPEAALGAPGVGRTVRELETALRATRAAEPTTTLIASARAPIAPLRSRFRHSDTH